MFSRAFKARVQPVELARKLAKEMESYKTVSVSRTYVPNEYIVFLSREDRRQFEGYEPALLDELSAHLLEHAARENLALLTRPKVSFETDKRLRMGEFGIQARLVKPPRDRARGGVPGRSRRDDGLLGRARARRRSREPAGREAGQPRAADAGRQDVRDRPAARGGRAAASRCDFVLEDPNVSRRHFELQLRGADWYVVDLESTNGVAVNGRQVSPAPARSRATRSSPGPRSLRFNVD